MRRWLILKAIALLLLAIASSAAAVTKAQEQHVRARARQYEGLIAAAAARHGVDPHLLWVIAYQETRFRPGLVSPKGARGLMQFMPGTAARYGLPDPHDPAQAIDAAARYVRDLMRRFGGNPRLVLAAYNSGEGAVEAYLRGRKLILPTGKVINARQIKTGGVPPYHETREYVSGAATIYRNITDAKIFRNIYFGNMRPLTTPIPILKRPPDEASAPEEAERSMYMTAVAAAPYLITQANELPTATPATSTSTASASGVRTTRSIYIP